jgi:hypothetical protein
VTAICGPCCVIPGGRIAADANIILSLVMFVGRDAVKNNKQRVDEK